MKTILRFKIFNLIFLQWPGQLLVIQNVKGLTLTSCYFDNLLLVFLNLQVQVTNLSFHVYQGSMHNKHVHELFKT